METVPAWWVPESGQTDLGIPKETGVSAQKVLPARFQELAGAEKIRYAEEIAGAMTMASVGCNIFR